MERKKKLTAGICVLLLLCCGCGETTSLLYHETGEQTTQIREKSSDGDDSQEDISGENASKEEGKSVICVYLCGEVKKPGVYELRRDQRIWDGVQKAGGFTEKADQEAVNLAGRMEDGQQIRIPAQGEAQTTESVEKTVSQEQDGAGLVNINTADEQQLITLPGIGQARAQSIISYRQENGPFTVLEDIMKVSGIKEAAFAKIKDKISVE